MHVKNLEFDYASTSEEPLPVTIRWQNQLAAFREFGTSTQVVETPAKTFRARACAFHVCQRVLDSEAARCKQLARGFLPSLLQAATASLLHPAPHPPRGPQLSTPSWGAAPLSLRQPAGASALRLRHQSPEPGAHRAQAAPANTAKSRPIAENAIIRPLTKSRRSCWYSTIPKR